MRPNMKGFFMVLSAMAIAVAGSPSLLASVRRSLVVTQGLLEGMEAEWEVRSYPNFLRAAYMDKGSWNRLRVVFEQRVLAAAISSSWKNFTIAFTGSSVTAGQDSAHASAFPQLVGPKMAEAFKDLRINLVSRNVAMGNNPCMPYDPCVRTFVGDDADIVHWEQSYNCIFEHKCDMLEQFIRQSRFIPSMPVVAISSSSTPNWKADSCKGTKPYKLSPEDLALFKHVDTPSRGFESVVTSDNRRAFEDWGGHIPQLMAKYPHFGIQLFRHDQYEAYKCQGPYVASWGVGVRSWHPSLHGHALRAAHYTYVWLSVWKSALKGLEKRILLEHHETGSKTPASGSGNTPADVLVSMPTLEKLHREASIAVLGLAKASETLPAPIWPTELADDVQCFTDFEPRERPGSSLASLVTSGLDGKVTRAPKSSGGSGWKSVVFEMLMDPDGVRSAKLKGYKDWKNIIYGNNESGALTLEVPLKKRGKIFLCESPGIWNKIPADFAHIWDAKPDIRMVSISGNKPAVSKKSLFKKSDGALSVVRAKEGDICVVSKDTISPGTYYLTIKPKTHQNIMLATIVAP